MKISRIPIITALSLLIAAFLTAASGCSPKKEYITFTGVVEEVFENGVLISAADLESGDKASVSFAEGCEIGFDITKGMKVKLTILPEIRESYPVQATAVKIEPA